jgi:hypothetical protein
VTIFVELSQFRGISQADESGVDQDMAVLTNGQLQIKTKSDLTGSLKRRDKPISAYFKIYCRKVMILNSNLT